MKRVVLIIMLSVVAIFLSSCSYFFGPTKYTDTDIEMYAFSDGEPYELSVQERTSYEFDRICGEQFTEDYEDYIIFENDEYMYIYEHYKNCAGRKQDYDKYTIFKGYARRDLHKHMINVIEDGHMTALEIYEKTGLGRIEYK